MNYIIFDLEWNQSSHPDHASRVDKDGKPLPFEIVEIGAVKLNENRDMVGEFSELVKPQIYHEMHYITSKLIHLQMEQLEKGKPYIDVLDEREKEVIVGRFGLDLKKEKTQREIAKELGISRSYVSRIEKRALMKMFHEFYRAEKEKRKKK